VIAISATVSLSLSWISTKTSNATFPSASNFANKSLLGTDVFAWAVKVPFVIFVFAIVAPAATGRTDKMTGANAAADAASPKVNIAPACWCDVVGSLVTLRKLGRGFAIDQFQQFNTDKILKGNNCA
jgi:hypothetical protein